MADRVTTIRLRAEIADLKRQMAEAGVAVKGVGDAAEKASERSNAALSSLSNTAGLLGLAMVAAAGAAVMAFANFDQSMSAVQAATHESASNMGLLRDAALEAGKRTVFSATEAAGAVEELAKAGVETTDILNGGLNGALDLAAAGGLDVAEAAGIAAVALKQFNLGGDEMSHVADLLAAGAGKAMGSVSDLGMALRQAGQVANSTGLTIEETTAGLSAFASAGLIGSDAGTSFKSMLQRLTPQSAEAQAKMDELGISAYDAGGNFIGLAEFAGNLQGALKTLTPEQRNSALATIFGSDAVRAANVLYDEGAQGIAEWTVKVNDAGYAAETAAIRLDNLKGDLEQLSGSVETAMIGLGEGANGPLRWLVQGATDLVNALTTVPAGVQGITLALVGGGGLVLLGVAGIGKLSVAITEAKAAMATLGWTAKGTTLAVAGVAAGLAIASLAIGAWVSAQAEARAKAEAYKDTLDAVTMAITDQTRAVAFDNLAKSGAITAARNLGMNLDVVVDAALGSEDALSRLGIAQSRVNDTTHSGLLAFASMVTGTQDMQTVVNALGYEFDSLTEGQQLARDATAAGVGVTEDATAAAEDLAGATDTTTGAIEEQSTALKDLIDLQREAAGVVLSVRDAESGFQAAIDGSTAALEKNGQNLDIGTEAGRENRAALDEIASSTWELIASMDEADATQGELQAAMATGRQAFLDAAGAMGIETGEANALADQLELIPASVNTTVNVSDDEARLRADNFIAAYTNRQIPVVLKMRADMGALSAAQYAAFSVAYSGGSRSSSGGGFAGGGLVTGPGTTTSDSIPALLSDREYIVKADAVDHYGPAFFDSLNAMRFASGGMVGGGSSAPSGMSGPTYNVTNNISTTDPLGGAIAANRRLVQLGA